MKGVVAFTDLANPLRGSDFVSALISFYFISSDRRYNGSVGFGLDKAFQCSSFGA